MDIIFHIGFPKCASTTLQNQVFLKYAPGYLGTAKTMPGNYAKQFQRFSPIGVRFKGNMKLANVWAENVLSEFKAKSNVPQTLIASSEFYTNWNKLKVRPIIGFLKKFSDEIWDYGDVKVLVVIRNQAEKLASGYAQTSDTNMYASQENFNKKIIKITSRNSRSLEHSNYAKWIKELHQNFGADNVCTLLMEEIGQLKFWKELKEFCQLDNFEPESMLQNKSYTSHRMSKNTWGIKPFDAGKKAKVLTDKILGVFWPHHVLTEKRKELRQKFIQRLARYYKTRYTLKVKDLRGDQIELTDDLKKDVIENFKSMNKQLELLSKTDLSGYGYY